MAAQDVCFFTATELSHLIHAKELSSRDVVEAHLKQIELVNPKVTAIVTLVAERAMERASQIDEQLARGEVCRALHGVPVVHKDMALTAGIRTTFGSPIFRDFVPAEDDLVVGRLKDAGAVSLGKSNTPEFGAGSQTYNEVFGATLNPYDTTRTCGGSSGGAAVALACGMTPLADGSDMGGSLRNPANFCNVVGFRPSIGRVPAWPSKSGWETLNTQGPMARTVQDVALMLSVIAGPDARSPIALERPASDFACPLERDFRGVRVAWSRDVGGLPVEPGVTAVLDAQRHVFEGLGCAIDDSEPDFADADMVFKTLRAWTFDLLWGRLLRDHRHEMKDALIWNIEAGQKLTSEDLVRAEIKRTALYQRVCAFLDEREFMVLPVNQVKPFPVTQEYVHEINGVKMETYIDWMKSCYYITILGLPAISVPCGFTSEGLPVGVQIVGRPRDDFGVLQLAHAFEQATGFWKRRPSIASG